MRIGDVVSRFSHHQDMFFRIAEIEYKRNAKANVLLKGLNLRLVADAPLDDLVLKKPAEIMQYQREDVKGIYQKLNMVLDHRKKADEDNDEFFKIPGRVLHLDGDEEYLKQCLKTYRQMGLEATGIRKSEAEQPKVIYKILQENPTDILVLTGHDGFLRGKRDFRSIESYRSSRYFVQSVKEARRYEPNKDNLVIFAGACQSNYEAILAAGANFASSPKRMMIHAFDPVFIVERIAFTPIDQTISLKDVLAHTVTGEDGVGGIQTKGQMRKGYPRSPY